MQVPLAMITYVSASINGCKAACVTWRFVAGDDIFTQVLQAQVCSRGHSVRFWAPVGFAC